MKLRPSPALVVAVLAVVIALTGTSYAAAKITSQQIKNETIKSADVKDASLTGADLANGGVATPDLADGSVTGAKLADGSLTAPDLADGSVTGAKVADGSLTGADVADGSLSSADVARSCPASTAVVSGVCIDKAATGPTTFAVANADCDARGGRLMRWVEYSLLLAEPGITWADGNASSEEFLGEVADGGQVFQPVGIDRNGYIDKYSAGTASYWHRCVTTP